MGVRVCVDIGWCDFICRRDAIEVVSARDMVRLTQCICTMFALFRSILWSHLSPLHCHDFVHVYMCEYAVFFCFALITDALPLYVSPHHGFGCVYLASPRFVQPSCYPLRCGCLFICRSAVGKDIFVSRHCALTVPVTPYLGCSVFVSVVHNNCSGAPQRLFSHRDTLQQRICPCVTSVSSYVRNLIWCIFLLQLCLTGGLDGLVGLRESADVLAGELR